MSYIGTEPKDIRSFGRTKFDYTATQGQTAFTGADDDGKVLAFTVGQIEVYVNGILMDDSDFTTTGTGTVTLASAANLNDVINIVSFETNIPDSDYVPASGGTFTGNVTHSGTVTNSGAVTNSGNVTVGGTLGVTGDFSVDTDTLKVNTSDDRVLINTTLAGRATEGADILTVAAPDNGHSGITVRSGTSSYGSFYFSDATTGAGEYAASMQFNHSNNQLALGVGGSDYLKIDSTGRVTMPNQPFIHYRALDNTTHTTANVTPRWQTADTVRGTNGYNTSTGVYTAPVSGVYACEWAYLYAALARTAYIDDGYLKNGAHYYTGNRYEAGEYDAFADDYTAVQGGINIYLAANDTFSPRTSVSGDTSWNFYSGSTWGYLTIALIG